MKEGGRPRVFANIAGPSSFVVIFKFLFLNFYF